MCGKTYQMKVSLKGVKPKVWRRILVEDDVSFFKLQKSIAVAFDWPFSKFSEFKVRGVTVCQRHSKIDFLKECLDSVTTRLRVFNLEPGENVVMRHDLVDKWMFDIEVEAYVRKDQQITYPVCVEYSGQAPPIELGSPQDFAVYQKAIEDCEHIAHEFYTHQYSEYKNSFASDLEKMNKKMRCI